MTLDLATLGRRLAAARTRLGMTQDAAAEALALPRTAVVQIEAGRRSVSTLELAEFAKLYRVPVAEFFDTAAPADEDPLVALGRISEELRSSAAASDSIRKCVDLFREGAELTQMLGRESAPLPPSYAATVVSHAQAAEQGIAAAEGERRRLDLGDAPIADICRLISEQGIWAVSADLPEGFSGLFLHHSSTGAAVVVKKDHPLPRKRFSYAHEFAHALFDRDLKATFTAKSNATDLAERRANAFAAAFLMPKGGVESLLQSLQKGGPSRRSYTTYDVAGEAGQEAEQRVPPGTQAITFREVAALCAHFGVSYQAACYRLRELGYINKADLEGLLAMEETGREYALLLSPNREPTDDQDKELIAQLIPLALEAYARECISRGKLRELAGKLELPESRVLKFTDR